MLRAKVIGLMAVLALLGSASPAASAPKPVTVWEDKAGDSGADYQATPIPGSEQAGVDLVSGSIARNKANLEFTVTHSAMPPFGSLPEAARFLWAFAVDGKVYRFTAKRADVGKPDVIGGTGNERVGKVATEGHFRLEGDCASEVNAAANFINCAQLAYLEGTFDPAGKTFTIVLPMELVKAKTGSVITAGSGNEATICTICWVSHLGERSHQTTLLDTALMTTSYKVPK